MTVYNDGPKMNKKSSKVSKLDEEKLHNSKTKTWVERPKISCNYSQI